MAASPEPVPTPADTQRQVLTELRNVRRLRARAKGQLVDCDASITQLLPVGREAGLSVAQMMRQLGMKPSEAWNRYGLSKGGS